VPEVLRKSRFLGRAIGRAPGDFLGKASAILQRPEAPAQCAATLDRHENTAGVGQNSIERGGLR
jgi:hypothetical protein